MIDANPPRNKKSDVLVNSILYRLTVEDRPGVVADVTTVVAENHQPIRGVNAKVLDAHFGILSLYTEDWTLQEGFRPVISLCRALQTVKHCNHLLAEFVRTSHAEPDKVSVLHSGIIPFQSYYSGQLIKAAEPLHPDNSSTRETEAVLYELDQVAAELIRDPQRLFSLKPHDLERLIAEVYRVHGLEVRVTGGPRDHGIDASATAYVPMSLPKRFSQHLRIGIQVKRYSKARKVSESELRNFKGSLSAEGFDRGILVTTSSMTAAAAHYLETRRTVRDRVTVIAGEEVLELLVSYCKQKLVPFWR
jgi:hypothetical protein